MATGDDAIAAGMDVVPGTADRRQGYDEINKTRDYIAQRTNAVTPISKGGTGASNASAARTALGLPAISSPGVALENGVAVFGPNKRLQVQDPEQPSDATTKYWVDNTIAYHRGQLQTDIDSVRNLANGKRNADDGTFSGDVSAKNVYAREAFAASNGWTAAYINSDGRLAKGTSSLRYKDLLDDPDVSTLGDIWPTLRQYAMKNGDGKPTLGYIAEEVAANPDTPRYAVYQWAENEDGQWVATSVVDSIDFIQLLIAQTVQLHARVAALEVAQQPTPAPEIEDPS